MGERAKTSAGRAAPDVTKQAHDAPPGDAITFDRDLPAKLAHELNNPLDGVLRYVNLAITRLNEDSSPEALDCLQKSRDGLLRMARIVREVLGYARSNAPGAPLVDINETVEDAIRSLQERAADGGVVMTASLRSEHMPKVRGGGLRQVCENLITNALESMPQGGLLAVSTGVVGDEVILKIEDNGVGLPKEADRIFEPFFTTKSAEGGTGLGLAICRDYATKLGGSIEAHNRAEGGAVFTVRLPVAGCAGGVDSRRAAKTGEGRDH